MENHEDHDKCIEIYEKENRIVLTKGSVYDRLRKYIPDSHLYQVQEDVSICNLH